MGHKSASKSPARQFLIGTGGFLSLLLFIVGSLLIGLSPAVPISASAMNSDYGMLFPLMLAAAIGYAVARRFQPGSAYTFVLPGMGIHLEPGTFTAVSSTDDESGDDLTRTTKGS